MTELTSKTDLHARAYRFGINVIKLTNELPNKRSALVISDQIIRSATSIGANLVEARSATSRLEFKRYNEISLKSANETKYWLAMLGDAQLISKDRIRSLQTECVELSNMLASGIIRLKARKVTDKF